ncbi:hypothetical protein ACQKEK_02040 [Pseudomonas sp. NPDC077408]
MLDLQFRPEYHDKAFLFVDVAVIGAGEIEQDYAAALAWHDLELAAWQAERDAHEKERAEVDKAFRLAAKGYSAHMEAALDLVLSGIAWPKPAQVVYLFSHDNSASPWTPTCRTKTRRRASRPRFARRANLR